MSTDPQGFLALLFTFYILVEVISTEIQTNTDGLPVHCNEGEVIRAYNSSVYRERDNWKCLGNCLYKVYRSAQDIYLRLFGSHPKCPYDSEQMSRVIRHWHCCMRP